MNIEDIKVGETYNVRVTVEDKSDRGWIEVRTSENAYPVVLADTEAEAFSSINHENGIKNNETAPKYDPCRLLREGDKVQVIARNGRCWGKTGEYLRGAYCFVLEDEERNAMVKVRHNSSEYVIDPAYLELVTPVEELEPYFIEESSNGYRLMKHNGKLLANYWETHPYAKVAAEAECARLNEDWRKAHKHE